MPFRFHLIWNALVITSSTRSTWYSTEPIPFTGPPSQASPRVKPCCSVADLGLLLTAVWVWNYCFLESVFPFVGSFPYFVGVFFLVISKEKMNGR